MEKTKFSWASTDEVCAAVGIGKTRIKDLKASGELKAGKHWVYKSGRKGSPLGWDLEAVREWQRLQTERLANSSMESAKAIESYSTMGA